MRWLVIETSSREGEVGLAESGRLIAQRSLSSSQKHARDLAPGIADLFHETGWTARELGGVVVDLGPGSYTGLRAGLMTAKAFSYALEIPLFAVEADVAVAWRLPANVDRASVIFDAQQGLVYRSLLSRSSDGGWERDGAMKIVPVDEWAREIPTGCWVAGPALSRYAGKVPETAHLVPPTAWQASAEGLCSAAIHRVQKGDLGLKGDREALWNLEPLYLRPSSAEEKWERRRGP